MSKQECDLDQAFADKVKESTEFCWWVLDHTKFRGLAADVRLLHEEQGKTDRKVWWKHWWCFVPEIEEQRETDIFLVFQIEANGKRFALHIENKRENGKFSDGQAEGYGPRARHMMSKDEYLDYSDFETVLIAPSTFRKKYREECDLFGAYISYEEIANFIPEFDSGGSMS